MFPRKVTAATIATTVGVLAIACGSPAPEDVAASSQSALMVNNPNNECYGSVGASFWLTEAEANTTLDTELVWYQTDLTAPAGAGPTPYEPYVAFAGVLQLTASADPTEVVTLAWVPQDEAGNFTLFNSLCSAGSGSGVGAPLPGACQGSNLPVPRKCILSAPSQTTNKDQDCHPALSSYACITLGAVKAFASDNSCASYVDTFCN
jgi:hypothetical protein